jgi:hypothetical protein
LEDLFTENTRKYFMLNTVEDLFTQNTGKYFMLNTVGRFIYTKYWEIINLPTVFNIKYFPVFCVNKSSHSNQDKVFPSILCKLIFLQHST